jgi:hypothetical protein
MDSYRVTSLSRRRTSCTTPAIQCRRIYGCPAGGAGILSVPCQMGPALVGEDPHPPYKSNGGGARLPALGPAQRQCLAGVLPAARELEMVQHMSWSWRSTTAASFHRRRRTRRAGTGGGACREARSRLSSKNSATVALAWRCYRRRYACRAEAAMTPGTVDAREHGSRGRRPQCHRSRGPSSSRLTLPATSPLAYSSRVPKRVVKEEPDSPSRKRPVTRSNAGISIRDPTA